MPSNNTIVSSFLTADAVTPRSGLLAESGMLVRTAISLLAALLTWRTWRFVISPLLHPEYPEELPYWIPCHARAFFMDSNGLLDKARQHFQSGPAPFAITALGNTFFVVLDPQASAEVYKNTETLSFESYVRTLMKANGNSDDVIRKMYSALPINKSGFPNPLGESLGVLAQRMHTHQLQPGQNLVDLQRKASAWISKTLNLDGLHRYMHTQGTIELSLYRWCSDYFVRLGQYVYFGDLLDEVDPLLPDKYFMFDELIWKMLYQYPGILSRDMTTARSQVIASLKRFFQMPPERRRHGCAWLINAWEDEAKAIGVDDDNLAVLIFFLYFAINTNTRKTAFWLLAYLLHNPVLLEAFRRETAPAFRGSALVDPFYFQDAERTPQVDAIWNETLRNVGWSASVRLITEDTVIGGKMMRRGNRVMVPHRLLHFEGKVFGEEPGIFRPERWNDPGLARSHSWKPFGAGKTLCSGRFLARFSVTTFVATLLMRFDLEMVGDPAFPDADKGRPVLGIVSIKEGQDFNVKLTPRKEVIY